ncbi:MAG: GPW/gp25 family protein, partial [Planctomycetes bacterium]|nr:GPW/gp25 family protein [Planctomycetota bacterium]
MMPRRDPAERRDASPRRGAWGLSFAVGRDGRLRTARGDDLAETAKLILAVAPRERPLRPEFGCRIHALESIRTARERQVAAALAEEALHRWAPELGTPRVEVLDVEPPRVKLSVAAGARRAEVWIRCLGLEASA